MSLLNPSDKIYFIFIFFSFFSKIFSIYFTFPTSTTLINGNIFIIHKYGISICDSELTTIIKNVTIFDQANQLKTEKDLEKIKISKYEDGYIFCIILNYLYIFNNLGEFKYKKEMASETDLYITLALEGINSNQYYYYLIGYVKTKLLYLFYYRYDSARKDNKLYANTQLKDEFVYDDEYHYNEYDIENNGVTCQFMKYKGESIITCFYNIKANYVKYISIAFLCVKNSYTSYYIDTKLIFEHYESDNIVYFKSAINSDNTIAFVGMYNSIGKAQYFIFNINSYDFNIYPNDKCSDKYYGLKIDYFKERKKFAYSCLRKENGIITNYFDEPGNNTHIKNTFVECENIYGYSLLLLNSKQYYILSDVLCNEINYPFELLMNLEEEKDEEEEEEEKRDEEEEKEEEEEKKEEEEEKKEEEELKIEVEEEEEEEKNIEEEELKIEVEEEEEEEKNIEEDLEEREEENKQQFEKEENKCEMEKCRLCNKESISKNLCIECNKEKGYYYLNNNPKKLINNNEYRECVNNATKPSNFYLNKENKDYRPCYQTCAACEYGGDGNENNCTLCDKNYIFRPDIINSKNCIIKCPYFYYYTKFGQYKCTTFSKCPDEYSLLIIDKGKCTDNCQEENLYKYNGECWKECPDNTSPDEINYICKDIITKKCLLSESEFNSLDNNLTDKEINKFAKDYSIEFQYTDNHVSIYKNNIYTITFYKNKECIFDLSLKIPEINFGECYTKVKNNHKINDTLVIAIITKNLDEISYPKMISYSMYDPYTGNKLESNEICDNEPLVVEENLFTKLNNTNTDMESLKFLTDQNIDVFNLLSAFYTDICYDFDPPIEGKDIPLKDRIKLYFPNITLCEEGCKIKGVDLETLKAKCECKLNDLINSNFFGNNIILQSQLGQIEILISKTNIEVIKCYKNAVIYKYFITNVGAFIIITFLLIEIISTIIYYLKSKYLMRKYIFGLTDKYLTYLSISKNNNNNLSFNPNVSFYKKSLAKNSPPKKIENVENPSNVLKNGRRKRVKAKTRFKKYSSPIMIIDNIDDNDKEKKKYNRRVTENKKKFKNLIHKNTSKNISNETLSIKVPNLNLNSSYKHSSDEMFNSKDQLNKHIISNRNLKKDLMVSNLNEIVIDVEEYLKTEPDDMDYDDAIKKDKRKFCEIFLEKLKNDQISLNTFYAKEPLKPRPIKIILFILYIVLYLFINGLFFSQDYISKIFETEKDDAFKLIDRFMERFLEITIAGIVLIYIIDFFFIEEKKIKKVFKREKENIIILKYEIFRIISNIINRYNCFIIVTFVITSFILYYTLCFNSVYPSMKGEWIKTSLIIIISMQVLSFLECFLETLIRFLSFRCKSEKLYKISFLLA